MSKAARDGAISCERSRLWRVLRDYNLLGELERIRNEAESKYKLRQHKRGFGTHKRQASIHIKPIMRALDFIRRNDTRECSLAVPTSSPDVTSD